MAGTGLVDIPKLPKRVIYLTLRLDRENPEVTGALVISTLN